jgi:hypothetical protein
MKKMAQASFTHRDQKGVAPADLKLRQIWTFEIHMVGWLVRWARRAGARDFCPALVSPVQNI